MRRVSAMAALLGCLTLGARGQTINPVYVDDSPRAVETLATLDGFIASGNLPEASRALQLLLDEAGWSLVPSLEDEDLHRPVRSRVNEILLSNAELLSVYREVEGPAAALLLDANEHEKAERTRLLTRAGLTAALRSAQRHAERGRAHAALRTLGELAAHPDIREEPGAVRVASLVVSMLPGDPEAAEVLRELSLATGAEAPGAEPFGIPRPGPTVVDPLSVVPSLEAGSIPAAPLQTLSFGPAVEEEPADARFRRASRGRATGVSVVPVGVGDLVLLNDGLRVGAWDRFTLAPRWVIEVSGDAANAAEDALRRGRFGATDSVSTVAVASGTVVAIAGERGVAGRLGEERVVALTLDDGTPLWSLSLDEQPGLSGCVPTGRPVIYADTVVLLARKVNTARRLATTYLVGLDLGSGVVRWSRLLASTGSLPYQTAGAVAPLISLERGAVYVSDALGAVAGVDAGTGRPLWVRLHPVPSRRRFESAPIWSGSRTIVESGTVYAISPDGYSLLGIDAESGALLGERAAISLGNPDAIVRVDGSDGVPRLAAVASNRIAFEPLGESLIARSAPAVTLSDGVVVATPVAMADGRLLVPTTGGAAFVDVANASPAGGVALDSSGTALPLPGQLLVAGATAMHSYLVWERAEEVLESRMLEDPDDPTPAMTFAELAFRAGRTERLMWAVERAEDAVRGDDAARATLFRSLSLMARSGLGEADPPKGTPVIERRDTLRSLVRAMGRLADGSDERTTAVMTRGRLAEVTERPRDAVEAYHELLSDVDLASTVWRGGVGTEGGGLASRAELEADKRLRGLLRRTGIRIYAGFETEAQLAASAIEPGAEPERFARLAQRYPYASVSSTLWRRAGALWEARDSVESAIEAYRSTLDCWRVRASAGAPPEPADRASVAETLLDLLIQTARYEDARSLLAAYPALATPPQGIEGERALSPVERLAERLRLELRRPSLGAQVVGPVVRLPGWTLARPALGNGGGPEASKLVLLDEAGGRLGLADAMSLEARDGMTVGPSWVVEAPGATPISLSDRRLVIALPSPAGPLVRAIAVEDGRTLWETRPFEAWFPEPDAKLERLLRGARGPVDVEVPAVGPAPLTDVLFCGDHGTLALVERSGRAGALDLQTGQLLWARKTALAGVFGVDARSGSLAVVGSMSLPDDAVEAMLADGSPPARVAVFRLRTGEVTYEAEPGESGERDPPAWVRLGAGDTLLFGGDRGVSAIDLRRGVFRWELTHEETGPARAAWILGERAYLLGSGGALKLVGLSDGRVIDAALRTGGRLGTRMPVRAAPMGGDPSGPVAFASRRGLLVFRPDGERLGADAFDGAEALTVPVIGADYAVALDALGRPGPGGGSAHTLYVFDATTGRLSGERAELLLPGPAEEVVAIDGVLAVSAGGDTVLLPMPGGGA
ncbi:MAG: PQQ-binding-like beta-propeller repeat protein [Planctomycetota bacterium]